MKWSGQSAAFPAYDLAVLLRKLTLWSSGGAIVTTEHFFALSRALGEWSDDPGIGLKLPRLMTEKLAVSANC
jgi:hypothetical protein